eukprot:3176805-Rhodomonas_salina.1
MPVPHTCSTGPPIRAVGLPRTTHGDSPYRRGRGIPLDVAVLDHEAVGVRGTDEEDGALDDVEVHEEGEHAARDPAKVNGKSTESQRKVNGDEVWKVVAERTMQ